MPSRHLRPPYDATRYDPVRSSLAIVKLNTCISPRGYVFCVLSALVLCSCAGCMYVVVHTIRAPLRDELKEFGVCVHVGEKETERTERREQRDVERTA